MDHDVAKLCAMRLDTSVRVEDFVQQLDWVRRNARESAYRDLRDYKERGGSLSYDELIPRLASGFGWPQPELVDTTKSSA